MAEQRPFSIKIFVPDGDPDGLRIVEKSNWTGEGVVFNRTNYKAVAGRPEFDQTGVYVLVGSSEDSSLPTIYVGEGDPVGERLKSHYSNKDFWTWAVFFVTKDSSLNKAHVKHLESRLLGLAKEAKQCKLDNATGSTQPTLSDSDKADVESFLLDMLSIYPLLGLNVFEKTETEATPELVDNLLYLKAKGVEAKAYEAPSGFVVVKGSQMVKSEVPSLTSKYRTLRKDLLEQGVLSDDGDCYVLTQDQVFSGPSAASAVLLGADGYTRSDWVTKDGTTLKELQEAAAEEDS